MVYNWHFCFSDFLGGGKRQSSEQPEQQALEPASWHQESTWCLQETGEDLARESALCGGGNDDQQPRKGFGSCYPPLLSWAGTRIASFHKSIYWASNVKELNADPCNPHTHARTCAILSPGFFNLAVFVVIYIWDSVSSLSGLSHLDLQCLKPLPRKDQIIVIWESGISKWILDKLLRQPKITTTPPARSVTAPPCSRCSSLPRSRLPAYSFSSGRRNPITGRAEVWQSEGPRSSPRPMTAGEMVG